MGDENANTNDQGSNFAYEGVDAAMLSMITSAITDTNVSDYQSTAFLDAMRTQQQPDVQYASDQGYVQSAVEEDNFNPVSQVNAALNEMRRKISSWIDQCNADGITAGEKADLTREIDNNFRLSVYCYSIFQCKYASGETASAGSTKSRMDRLYFVSKPFCSLLANNYLLFNDTLPIPDGVSLGTTLVNKVARSTEYDIASADLDRIKLVLGILITILEPNLNKKLERDLSVSSNWSSIQSFPLIDGCPAKPIPPEIDQALDIIFERYAQAEFDQYHSLDSRRFGSLSDVSRRAILRVLAAHNVPLVNFTGLPVSVQIPVQPQVSPIKPKLVSPVNIEHTIVPDDQCKEDELEEKKQGETVWLPSLSVCPSEDSTPCDTHMEPPTQVPDVQTLPILAKESTTIVKDSTAIKKQKAKDAPVNREKKPSSKGSKKRKISEISTPTEDEPPKKKKEPFVNQIAVQMILCHMMTTDKKYEKGVSFDQWLAFIKQYPGLIECHYKDIISDNDELIKRFRNAPRKRKEKAFFSSTGPNTYGRKCDDADWAAFVAETKVKWEEFETQHAKWRKGIDD